MNLRNKIIAVLVVFELAIVGEAVVAVRAGTTSPTYAASPSNLVEGGPHMTFDGGAFPKLTVDIGLADLTVLTSSDTQIDVSVSPSSDFGFFRATQPITARDDGNAVRVASDGHGAGDNRMVTVVVPPDTQVTVVSAGDIKVSGLRGPASISSAGSGTVSVVDYNGPSLHVLSNGRVSLHQIVSPHLDATSDDDAVDATGLQVRDGAIASDDDVSLGFASGTDTIVTSQTKDGKIKVAGFEGLEPSGSKSDGGDEDSASQTVKIGGGDGHFDVHSKDGDISLTSEN